MLLESELINVKEGQFLKDFLQTNAKTSPSEGKSFQ